MPFPFPKTKRPPMGGPGGGGFRATPPPKPPAFGGGKAGKQPFGGGKQPFGKMMADGGAMGAPSPLGGGADSAPPTPGAAPPTDDQMGMEGVVKPESVNYHDDAQSCQSCEYMGDGGQCAVLKMQVSPEGGCNAFEAKGGEGEGGMQPGEDMGGTDEGTSGFPQ